jgi:hypothetical protein
MIYIPHTSFYDIHKSFYGHEHSSNTDLDNKITYMLSHMFSTTMIRILTARLNNPDPFKTVTLFLDGHDTRGIKIGTKSEEGYSYKLKKSGFCTQVCIDVNGMVIFVSESLPCKVNTDGKMLANMDLKGKIDKCDCIAVDGGYTLHLKQIIEDNQLKKQNFCHPI